MRIFFLLGLIGLLPFCTQHNKPLIVVTKYDSVKVDTNFSGNFAFRVLDNAGFISEDESGKEVKGKKSSNVMLLKIEDKKDKFFPHDYYDCEAELIKDTLKIGIGGIYILVAGGKFHAEPYEFSYNRYIDEKEPYFKVEKQKLVLSKLKYSLGDSVYGYIYSRLKDDMDVKYYAVGYFRTTVSGQR
jgi:hypothetical protein